MKQKELPMPDITKQQYQITEDDRTNFATLCQATLQGRIALIDVYDIELQQAVPMIVALNPNEDGGVQMVPLATLTQGNPFDRYIPPDGDGGYKRQHTSADN